MARFPHVIEGSEDERQLAKAARKCGNLVFYKSKKWGWCVRTTTKCASERQRQVISSWGEWLRLANIVYKFTSPLIVEEVNRQIASTNVSARDVIFSAMNGLLFYLEDEEGRRWYSMAHRERISASLDVFSQSKGSILVRGDDLWEAIPAGPKGTVLTSNGSGELPSWQPIADGGVGLDLLRILQIDKPNPPILSRFMRVGLGDRYEAEKDGLTYLGRIGNSSGNGWSFWLEEVNRSFRLTVGMVWLGWKGPDANIGLVAYRSSNSKFVAWGFYKDGLDVARWTFPNTFNGIYVSAAGHRESWALLSLEGDLTGFRAFYIGPTSIIGRVYSGSWEHTGAFPDRVGIGVRVTANSPLIAAVFHYELLFLE